MNLTTKYGQTFGFSAKDHVNEVTNYLGRDPDFVIINNAKLPEEILKRYAQENGFAVEDNLDDSQGYKVIRANILVPEEIARLEGDVVKRSLLRHDPDRLAWEIVKISKELELNP